MSASDFCAGAFALDFGAVLVIAGGGVWAKAAIDRTSSAATLQQAIDNSLFIRVSFSVLITVVEIQGTVAKKATDVPRNPSVWQFVPAMLFEGGKDIEFGRVRS